MSAGAEATPIVPAAREGVHLLWVRKGGGVGGVGEVVRAREQDWAGKGEGMVEQKWQGVSVRKRERQRVRGKEVAGQSVGALDVCWGGGAGTPSCKRYTCCGRGREGRCAGGEQGVRGAMGTGKEGGRSGREVRGKMGGSDREGEGEAVAEFGGEGGVY